MNDKTTQERVAEWVIEAGKRGLELEKLRSLITGYKDLLPDAIYDNLMEPIASYEARCTQDTPFEKKRKLK